MAPTTKDQDSLEKGLKDLNLTNEELNKFEKAFKDPEFLKLFEEYAKEVSDPKVKAETDQYLRQLEEQGRGEDVYGKGVVLVTPKPSMVLKSKVLSSKEAQEETATVPATIGGPGSGSGARRDSLTVGQKVFINVCTSEKVDRYTLKQAKDASGRSGQHLSIPITMGPLRLGVDKQGQPAAVYDLVVHPETVEFAARSTPVMSTLADTALEQVEKVSRSRLSRNWRRLNSRYKATDGCSEPPVQCIRMGEGGEAIGGRLRPQAGVPAVLGVPEAKTAAAVGGEGGSAKGGGTASRSTFSFDRPKPKQQQQEGVGGEVNVQEVKDPRHPGFRHADGALTPEWSVVHRGEVDLAAAWGDAGRGLAMEAHVPKELLVRVTLPDVTSAAAVDLDVGERRLTLKVLGRYYLDVVLPYNVEENKGKAKLDKARKQLEITLPVVPPPPPAPSQRVLPAAIQELPPPTTTTTMVAAAVAATAATGGAEEESAVELPPSTGVAGNGAGDTLTETGPETPGWSASATSDAAAIAAAPAARGPGKREGEVPTSSEAWETAWEAMRDAGVTVQRGPHGVNGRTIKEAETEAVPETGDQTQMTENERRWRELHARQAAEPGAAAAVAAVTAVTASGRDLATTSEAPKATGGVGDGAAAAVVAATTAAASTNASNDVPGSAEPTVLLPPRLRRDLAMELD